MITAKDSIKTFIKAQPSIDSLAKRLDTTRATLYNIINGENISSDLISKLLKETNFEFEKAFELSSRKGKKLYE